MKTTTAIVLLGFLGLLGGCSTSPSEPAPGPVQTSATPAPAGAPTMGVHPSDVTAHTLYPHAGLDVQRQLVQLSNALPPSDVLGAGLDVPETSHTDILKIAPKAVAGVYKVPVDTVDGEAYLFLGPQTDDPAAMDAALRDVVVVDPNGVVVNQRVSKGPQHDSTQDLAMSAIPLAGHPVGTYTVQFKSGAPKVGLAIEARLAATNIVMKLKPSTLEHLLGNQSFVDATLMEGAAPVTGAHVVADLVDGETGDAVAPIAFTEIGGGVYRAAIDSVLNGSSKIAPYLTDVRADGTTPSGAAFFRHGRTGFHYGIPSARLNGVLGQRTITDATGLITAFEVDVALQSASLDRLEDLGEAHVGRGRRQGAPGQHRAHRRRLRRGQPRRDAPLRRRPAPADEGGGDVQRSRAVTLLARDEHALPPRARRRQPRVRRRRPRVAPAAGGPHARAGAARQRRRALPRLSSNASTLGECRPAGSSRRSRPSRRYLATLATVAACGGTSSPAPLATSTQAVIGGGDDAVHTSVVFHRGAGGRGGPGALLGDGHRAARRPDRGALHAGARPRRPRRGRRPVRVRPDARARRRRGRHLPPLRGRRRLPGGTDLGAVLLAEDAGLPSVPLLAGDAAALLGGPVTVVGYGQSSASDSESSGTRRSAVTSVSAVCSAMLSFGDATTNACHGDSGGALLVAGDAGVDALAAVVSYGDELHCATATRAVRVDRYASWIADVLAGVASSDGGACADCPPPAADCEADAGSDGAAGDDGGVDAAAPAPDGGESHGPHGSGGCGVARGVHDASAAWVAAIAMVLAIAFRLRCASSCAASSSRSEGLTARSRSRHCAWLSCSPPARASPARTAPTRRGAAATRRRTSSA